MTASINDQRRDIETQLVTLRQRRGSALLDGKPFDDKSIHDLEAKLSALVEAEGEQVRRERAQTSVAEARRIDSVKARIASIDAERLDAIGRAEKAARDLSKALQDAVSLSADQTKLMQAVGVNPFNLQPFNVIERLSIRLTSAMAGVTGSRGKFGQITFPAARSPFDEPWRSAEEKLTQADLLRATEKAAS